MSSFLYRLGHASVRRRRLVLSLWILLLVAVAVAGKAAGGTTSNSFSIPGTESQQAFDVLKQRFPAQSGSTEQIVFAAPPGASLNDPELKAVALRALRIANQADGVQAVDPATSLVTSADGTVGYAQLRYKAAATEVDPVPALATQEAVRNAADGLGVAFGGEVAAHIARKEGPSSELIGLGVSVVVLLFAFGSVLAMGLPLVTALIGVGVGITGITLLSAFVDLSATAPTLATMIGLAVGIDYALFIITRHRQNLADGFDVRESIARANATAGGAVVFAGMTVVIALASLTVVGIPFLTVMGLAAAGTVAVAVAVAVTLMPAMLGFAGTNIDRFKLPGLKAHSGSAAESGNTISARFARIVTGHPGLSLVGGLAIISALAIPLFSMRTGMPDAGTDAPGSTTRVAYDTLAKGFGPGFSGPLTIVVDVADSKDPAGALEQLAAALTADADIAGVTPAIPNPAGDTSIITAIPRSAPSASETNQLVHRLRSDVIPEIASATNTRAYVSGPTATSIDISDKLNHALPIFMATVIGLTMVLLLIVFRSILIPIKAAVAILLSIGGAFGVLVAVFQWGWLRQLFGVHEAVPLISFLPIMMFAILFGLSMDYEVFILSRVREEYTHTSDARASVLSGLTSSARVITAAALIMISVFAAFMLGDNTIIKMFGLGLATAVLLDATVVRMIIVPAALTLFDRAAWWLPGWLDRLIPNVDIEGAHLIATLDGQRRRPHHRVHLPVLGDAEPSAG